MRHLVEPTPKPTASCGSRVLRLAVERARETIDPASAFGLDPHVVERDRPQSDPVPGR